MLIAYWLTLGVSLLSCVLSLIWWLLFAGRVSVSSNVQELARYVELRGRPPKDRAKRREKRREAREILSIGLQFSRWDLWPLTLRVTAVWAFNVLTSAGAIWLAVNVGAAQVEGFPVRGALGYPEVVTRLMAQTADALTFEFFSHFGFQPAPIVGEVWVQLNIFLFGVLTAWTLTQLLANYVAMVGFWIWMIVRPRLLAKLLRTPKDDERNRILRKLVPEE